jgi:uncharacterized phage protein (predicted DNA packaging)
MASLETEKMKRYLRLEADYHEEDEDISDLLQFSKEYIKNVTGKNELDNEVYRLTQKIIVSDRYENRGSSDMSNKTQNFLSDLLQQIQNCYGSGPV